MRKIINDLNYKMISNIIEVIDKNAYINKLYPSIKDLLISTYTNKNTVVLKNRNCGGTTALVFRVLMEIFSNLMQGDNRKMINIAIFDNDTSNSLAKNLMIKNMLSFFIGEGFKYDVLNKKCLMSKEYGFAIHFTSTGIYKHIPSYLDLALFDEFFIIENYNNFMSDQQQRKVITEDTKLFMIKTIEGIKDIRYVFDSENVDVKILTKE